MRQTPRLPDGRRGTPAHAAAQLRLTAREVKRKNFSYILFGAPLFYFFL